MNSTKIKKILKRKVNFVRQPIQNVITKPAYNRNDKYAKMYQNLEIEDNTILYESRDGKSMTDNPYAIFKYLIGSPEYKEYKHIWSIQNFEEMNPVINQYKEYDNVCFVKRNSTDYLKALSTSKYLINNSTFQSYVIPKEEQIYINTWHGTPLKKMGYEIPGNPAGSRNVVRNFLSANYLISPNAHTTNMYKSSFKLDGIYSGKIIEDGYPRIDLTLNSKPEVIKQKLISYGMNIDKSKKIILYAPTWKGTTISQAQNDMQQIIADMNQLQKGIGEDYKLLLKVHPFLYTQAKQYQEINNILVPDIVDTNELLSIVDVLITDYSSIFFDYIVTGRPILFYMWDAESYSKDRGSYFDFSELPGPILYNIFELKEEINKINESQNKHRDKYERFKKQFLNYDDGNVTERLINQLFNKNKNRNKVKIIDDLDKKKKKILMYPGGLMNNGITSSCINLLDNIDYDKYEVVCFMGIPKKAEVINNINKVDKRVHFLFRDGIPVFTLNEIYNDKMIHNRGASSPRLEKIYPATAYQREFRRLFGNTKFDIAIDFSGYSLYWTKYLLASNASKKICYLHSDMLADSERTVNGKRPHRVNLRGIFSVYKRYDKLVSVSEGTMEVNKVKLSQYAPEEKFDFVMNSLNVNKILGNEAIDTNNSSRVELEKNYVNNSYMRHAIISAPADLKVWNKPIKDDFLKVVANADEFLNKEVQISWEYETEEGSFYKFSIDHTIVGWLDKRAFTLLPDKILAKEKVEKLSIITNPKGKPIWNKPYNVYNTSRVSFSSQYKGMSVSVDCEARTLRGIYSHISINNTPLGWIHSGALRTIADRNEIGSTEFQKKKNKLIKKDLKKYKTIIDLFEKRPLRYSYVSKTGKIINLKDYSILSGLPSNPKSEKIENEINFLNKEVEITQRVITKENIYFFLYLDGEKLGWINRNAVEVDSIDKVISEREINSKAKVKLNNKHKIWSSPMETNLLNPIKGYEVLENKIVELDREMKTSKGRFYHISEKNKVTGWISQKALTNITSTLTTEEADIFSYISSENINFVTMGRLSPEKGQDNLIKAFALFNQKYPNSRLFIIGEGRLRKELEDLIDQLNLKEVVHLLGQQDRPFEFLRRCDCFILSSHYEGQSMVLLEAMTLEMDIIATDIVANQVVLENGKYGKLVNDSVEGLLEGMNNYTINNKNSRLKEKFDYKAYNDSAMDTFYKAIEE